MGCSVVLSDSGVVGEAAMVRRKETSHQRRQVSQPRLHRALGLEHLLHQGHGTEDEATHQIRPKATIPVPNLASHQLIVLRRRRQFPRRAYGIGGEAVQMIRPLAVTMELQRLR